MKKLIFILPVLAFLTACHPGKQWRRDDIDKQEKALLEEAKIGKIDTVAVNKLLANYQQYAADYPNDSMGADYLFKAADFCRYLHNPMKSIDLYGRVYNNYPTLSKRPYALFLQGFIYENELKNLSAARAKYQQFLDTYPNLPFARDVRITMNNMGKSPEELIHEFEEKQRQDSLANAK